MTEAEFERLKGEGYNRIPLVLETFADLDTPLSVYLKLANSPYSYLLESVVGGERFGRYSIIGLPAKRVLKFFGKRYRILLEGAISEEGQVDDPLAYVEAFQKRFRAAPIPFPLRFFGGLVGYFG
ncbi:MAG TPA: anthranilate synthase component I, partial [Burkholderiales bacterium]|nr:anthranilate synthase component I [Burkholderiales bacterium]